MTVEQYNEVIAYQQLSATALAKKIETLENEIKELSSSFETRVGEERIKAYSCYQRDIEFNKKRYEDVRQMEIEIKKEREAYYKSKDYILEKLEKSENLNYEYGRKIFALEKSIKTLEKVNDRTKKVN
jgi:small-conductance mechanosensitive channel